MVGRDIFLVGDIIARLLTQWGQHCETKEIKEKSGSISINRWEEIRSSRHNTTGGHR